MRFFFFFFNDTATTEIYTLSLHDALPIYNRIGRDAGPLRDDSRNRAFCLDFGRQRLGVETKCPVTGVRSEEHTPELQSPCNLVCRLLPAKKRRTMAWRLADPRPRRTTLSH